jgi:DNA-directed RNA polymerase specialized sigma24 family protein
MTPNDPSGRSTPANRLDAITTRWSLIRRAHATGERQAVEARNALVLRYAAAIRRYLGGILADNSDTDELAQEVMVRLLRGDFAGADPSRGRFRDLLKTAVRNMVRNHWSKQKRRRGAHVILDDLPTSGTPDSDPWLGAWQRTILDHAWAGLREFERTHPKNPAYTVLHLRVSHPNDTSQQLAATLAETLKTPIRPDAYRQLLRRARFRFAQLLIEEVGAGLDEQAPERVEEELAALGLLEHVRDFLPADWKARGRLEPTDADDTE